VWPPIPHALNAEIGAGLGDRTLRELRAELAKVIRHLAGEDIPALRPRW
jgi:hypothetical protein